MSEAKGSPAVFGLSAQVLEKMAAIARRGGNAASLHQLGQAVRRDVDAAARILAQRLGMPGAQVCFVSCVAEAHALGLLALVSAAQQGLQGDLDTDGASLTGAPSPVMLPRADGPWAVASACLRARGQKFTIVSAGQDPGAGPVGQDAAWPGCEAARVGEAAHLDVTQLCHAAPDRALIWPAGAAPASLAVDATALGGPLGIAALVANTVPSRAGTVPRELVVGFGAAAAAGLQKLA